MTNPSNPILLTLSHTTTLSASITINDTNITTDIVVSDNHVNLFSSPRSLSSRLSQLNDDVELLPLVSNNNDLNANIDHSHQHTKPNHTNTNKINETPIVHTQTIQRLSLTISLQQIFSQTNITANSDPILNMGIIETEELILSNPLNTDLNDTIGLSCSSLSCWSDYLILCCYKVTR